MTSKTQTNSLTFERHGLDEESPVAAGSLGTPEFGSALGRSGKVNRPVIRRSGTGGSAKRVVDSGAAVIA